MSADQADTVTLPAWPAPADREAAGIVDGAAAPATDGEGAAWFNGPTVPLPVVKPVSGQRDDEDTLHIDAVTALAARSGDLCAAAVDPLEIAAGLEADGVNDAIAAGRYHHPDVFALAETLWERTSRRADQGEPAANPWASRPVHHLLRGVLFGMPGLLYATTVPLLSRPHAVTVLLLSLLLSWSASEALSYLGYVRIGQDDRPGAARVMLVGGGVALAGVLGIVLPLALTLDVGAAATAVVVGQTLYLLAATALLVCGAEWCLLLALLPGAVASGVGVVWGPVVPVPAIWAAMAGSVLGTGAFAVVVAWRRRPRTGRRLSRREVLPAVPHGVFGGLAAMLVTFPVLANLGGRPGTTGAAAIAVPLSLSMGAGEWLLFRFRRRTHDLLRGSATLDEFARASRAALVRAAASYLLVLAGLAATTVWVTAGQAGGAESRPARFASALALGGALFVALALRSCGAGRFVLVACGGALLGEALVLGLGPRVHLYQDVLVWHLITSVALFLVLSVHALTVLGRATQHR